jgi:hypothetical protein
MARISIGHEQSAFVAAFAAYCEGKPLNLEQLIKHKEIFEAAWQAARAAPAQPAGERVKVARIKAGGGWHEVTDSKWIAEIFEADSIEYAIATIERIEK